jgi:hypothetical protein
MGDPERGPGSHVLISIPPRFDFVVQALSSAEEFLA